MRNGKDIDLLNEPVDSLVFKVTVPAMLAGLLHTSYSFIDMIFASRLGSVQVASIAFAAPLLIMVQAVSNGVIRGGVSIIAKLLGQDKGDEAAEYATHLRLVILTLSGIFTIAGIILVPIILSLINISDELYEQALIYTRISFYSMPLTLILGLYITFFKSQGKMKITSRTAFLGVVSNTVLNTFFIFILKTGIEGLAYASLITKFIQMLVVVILFHTTDNDLKLYWRPKGIISKSSIWGRLIKVGMPLSFSQASVHFGNLFLNIFIVKYGHEAVAAFAIGNRINSLMFFPSKEIGQGLIPLIAQNWGNKNRVRVQRAIRTGLIFSLCFGIFAATILQIIKYPIGEFLAKDDVITYQNVVNYVGIAGWTVIAWALFHTLQAIFTGFQKTSFTFYSNLFRLWGIRIPGIVLFQMFMPQIAEYGVWNTMFISNTLTLIFAIIYFVVKVPKILNIIEG